MYNLAPGKGVIIGDSVAIAEPFYSNVNLDIKDQVSNIKNLSGLEIKEIPQGFYLKDCYTKKKSMAKMILK